MQHETWGCNTDPVINALPIRSQSFTLIYTKNHFGMPKLLMKNTSKHAEGESKSKAELALRSNSTRVSSWEKPCKERFSEHSKCR